MTLTDRVKLAEGRGPVVNGRFMPYRDSVGVLTIGYGYNLEAGVTPVWLDASKGITSSQADLLLNLKLAESQREARGLRWFESLNLARQDAIVEMIYQLGLPKFLGFGKAIAALKVGDYATAAQEFQRSRWAQQTPGRAQRLARVIQTGVTV